MAWTSSTPRSGERAQTPTVFEQQREELVREIAVVSVAPRRLLCRHSALIECTGHGTSPAEHEPTQSEPGKYHHRMSLPRHAMEMYSQLQVGNEFGSVEALWSQFENFMGRPEEEVEEGGKRKGSEEGQDRAGTQQEDVEGDSTGQ